MVIMIMIMALILKKLLTCVKLTAKPYGNWRQLKCQNLLFYYY